MRSLRERLRIATSGDRGMTLIEVMVAMFVFAIISTMVLSSLLQVLTANRTSEAKHVAANLAAAEIELAHDVPDLFDLVDETRSQVVNGTTFTIRRETAWVTDSSADEACGTGGGNLRFKRVNVTVSWENMPASVPPVRADTVVDPSQRLNDPAKGTILVSVIDASGAGVPGTTVSLTATSDGAPVPATTTDAQGCAYFLQVTRGVYDVTITKSNHIGVSLETTPKKPDVSVQPGTTSSIGFQYDRAASLSATLAPGEGPVLLPRDFRLSFISTYGVTSAPLTGGSTTARSNPTFTVPLHPRVTYRLLGGNYGRETGSECTASDPNAWPETTLLDIELSAGAAPEVSADPGSAVVRDIPLGLVRIGSTANNLVATPAPGGPGEPTCGPTFTHTFGSVASGTTIALPYGTWRLTSSSGAVTATVVSRGSSLLDVVTLDPRQPAP
ncbi:carboxypeptidase regulatory-like domain-containing protein [Agrococcus sp. TSP3-2-1]|uniref:carboxypeptidase regulatory-like domain-containing protein n=1 Tax=Agrococcus sp. TSP3-2-1 TaxID=2804583 RepID=UPI003CFA6798